MFSMVCAMLLAVPGMGILTSTTPLSIMPRENVTIVDARPAAEFEAGHLPGAVNLDAGTLSDTIMMVPGMLKPLNQVVGMMGEHGIVPWKEVVIYAGGDGLNGVIPATRLFWVLDNLGYPNTSVLDGGFKKWAAEGLPVETGKGAAPEAVKMGEILPKLKVMPSVSVLRDEVWQMADSGTGILLDARKPEQFSGAEKRDEVKKAGHIKGAINVPADNVLDKERGVFKQGADLEAALAVLGAPGNKPVCVYCNTGRSASVVYFALKLAGYPKVGLYDGSMAEWASYEDTPIATGDK